MSCILHCFDNMIFTVFGKRRALERFLPGTVITASSEGRSGTATLTVTAPRVASITFPSSALDLPLRTRTQLAPVVRDENGAIVTDRVITYVSSAPTIASVTGTGEVRSLLPGTASITATVEGRTAVVTVTGTLADLSHIVDSIRQARGMLGSNTKALTGVLAGMAVEAGVLGWQRTVEQAIPELLGTMLPVYRNVTLLELLSNTAGVVNSNQGLTSSTNLSAARTAWADVSLRQASVNTRGTYFYSNNGFGIADAGWGPTTTAGGMDQPVGHRLVGNTWVPCEACDNPPGLSSAGTLHMSLRSWGRITQELLLADQGRSTRLSQTTARFLTANTVLR